MGMCSCFHPENTIECHIRVNTHSISLSQIRVAMDVCHMAAGMVAIYSGIFLGTLIGILVSMCVMAQTGVWSCRRLLVDSVSGLFVGYLSSYLTTRWLCSGLLTVIDESLHP